MPRLAILLLILVSASAGCTADGEHGGSAKSDPNAGFVPLFNGRDLTGWTHASKAGEGYRVKTYEARQGNSVAKEGVLYCTVKDGGNLITDKDYADFVLRLEFKLTPGANNGVAIRSPAQGRFSTEGMEIQILDDTAEKYAKLRPTQYCGSIYDVFAAERGHLRPIGEWNEEEITAKGDHVTIKLNGATIVDADLASVTDEKVLAKHPGLRSRSGRIGFLGHGAEVEFRNIFIKPL